MPDIKVSQLADEIVAQLKNYRYDLVEEIKSDVDRVAKNAVTQLRWESPKRTGKYSKGWRRKKVKERPTEIRFVLYNSKKPSLAHLLEYGRPGKGGTAKGAMAPQPHIRFIAEDAEKTLLQIAKERWGKK